MVTIYSEYNGQLRCTTTHEPSDKLVVTDAPTDNQGKGESFSPTDLVAAALGSCIITTYAIVAERKGWAVGTLSATVVKNMVADPLRRIGSLVVELHVPEYYSEEQRTLLMNTALQCPVHKTISLQTEITITLV
jgi:putative redox protein